jgi:electron transfer flavoprotein beta subunit
MFYGILLALMTILLTRCIDYAVKIRVNPQQTGVDTNVKHSMVSSQTFNQL